LCSVKTLVALIGAASLAPLWDYGFEIRHDNLLLTGVLISWWCVRQNRVTLFSYAICGAAGMAMLFVAFKSVVYVVPLTAAILVLPPPSVTGSRRKLALSWAAGATVALGVIRISYGSGGGWEIYLSVFHTVASSLAGGTTSAAGFRPWLTLSRLLVQTPLLLALTLAALVSLLVKFGRERFHALGWQTCFPELVLFLVSIVAFFSNPTPFPYNLIHVVPYAFLLSFRYCDEVWTKISKMPELVPVVVGILIFAHAIPFALVTRRHLEYLNWRQEVVMNLAEKLTDPDKDEVYDATGLVPTRRSVYFMWYLHSWNISKFLDGPGPKIHEIFSARPPSVFIANYRTDWLPEDDHAFIRAHYVPLADDFWVLGTTLNEGGGTFVIDHAGRYRISTVKGSDIMGTYPEGREGMFTPEDKGAVTADLDGAPLCGQPVLLAKGTHRLQTSPGCKVSVVWVGPHVDRIHRINRADHHTLFINWY
jgi:hypothetical protein